MSKKLKSPTKSSPPSETNTRLGKRGKDEPWEKGTNQSGREGKLARIDLPGERSSCSTSWSLMENMKVKMKEIQTGTSVTKGVMEGSECDRGASHGVTVAEVCENFEQHSCNAKSNCTDRHSCRTPFQWRVKLNECWISLENQNSLIESAFCDPSTEEFWDVESIPSVAVYINFVTMVAVDLGPVQRLTTPSYVQKRNSKDATRWQWYWHDAKSPQPWKLYGQYINQPPYQDVIEAKFLHDPSHVYRFEMENCCYEIDFAKMEQRNLRTNSCNKIRRRPINFEKTTAKLAIDFKPWIEYHCDLSKLPNGWVPMETETKDGTELVPLHLDDNDYKKVRQSFHATMSEAHFEVKKIYRLQNLELWDNYQTKKKNMERYTGCKTEVNAFHGTPKEESVRWIYSVGFDQRMNGKHGTKYGKGAYFARDAICSNRYTSPSPIDGLRRMFCARVLVGQIVKGNSEYRRPPEVDLKNPKRGLYDTCVDNISNPGIYVIFDTSQSYPEFLIEFRDIIKATKSAV